MVEPSSNHVKSWANGVVSRRKSYPDLEGRLSHPPDAALLESCPVESCAATLSRAPGGHDDAKVGLSQASETTRTRKS